MHQVAGMLHDHFPVEAGAILAMGERVLRGDFSEFCPLAREPQRPFPRWHQDLVTGNEWPLSWARTIDYSSDHRPGEIRHLWDLHRQTFLPVLAQAWLLSKDRRFLDRLHALFLDWWACNPVGYGIGWIGPQIQEHALRNVQWLTCLLLLHGDPEVPDRLLDDLVQGVHLQSKVLDWHYKPDKPVSHNHLVSESLGLWMAGLLLPGLRGAARWRRRGGAGLRAALELQFDEEGVHKEWATNYHAFVLESFLLARCLCAAHGDPLLDGLDDKLAGAARYVARLAQPDGRIPYIGDADDALAYRLAARPHETRRRYAATVALLLDRPELAAEAGELPAESLWLLGPQAVHKWQQLAAHRVERPDLSLHPGTNTLVLQDERDGDYLLVHGGPSRIEPRVGASHLHADRSSLVVWLGGREVWCDPGTWLYNGPEDDRNRFRGTRSHTTASLEGRDQCDVTGGRFRVADLPETAPLSVEAGPLRVRMETRGRAGGHLRLVARVGRALVVWDRLEGAGEWAEASFISPCAAEEEAWGLYRVSAEGLVPVTEGQAPWAGARSRRYGVKESARRHESRSTRRDPQGGFRLMHILLPEGEERPAVLPGGEGWTAALVGSAGLLAEPGWSGTWQGRAWQAEMDSWLWIPAGEGPQRSKEDQA